MKIAVNADHGGVHLKQEFISFPKNNRQGKKLLSGCLAILDGNIVINACMITGNRIDFSLTVD